jgi:hypothetical protein
MAVVRSFPVYKSPIKVTLSEPYDAAPTPWIHRNINNVEKLRVKAHPLPATAKTNKAGINIFFLPVQSANTPKKGVKNTPGRVKTVINNPIDCDDRCNAFTIEGNAGVILETPRTAIKVIPNTMWRFVSLYSFSGSAMDGF